MEVRLRTDGQMKVSQRSDRGQMTDRGLRHYRGQGGSLTCSWSVSVNWPEAASRPAVWFTRCSVDGSAISSRRSWRQRHGAAAVS